MKKIAVLFIFTFFIFISNGLLFAQRGSARAETVQIRLASSLPRNSDWGRGLDRLAADWERVTGNSVRVVVSHDGREGTEAAMLSSLSSNAIQAALFSSAGVSEICPAVVTLSVPFLIKTDNELNNVLHELRPVFNSKTSNDFVIIAWAKAGWLYVFTKEAVLTPVEMRRQKLATSSDLKDMNLAFRTMGFQMVEVDMAHLGTRLASNAINAVYIIPTAIAPLQLHRHLNHMLYMPIAPVMGALVMNRVTWNKLTSAQQQEIIRATQKVVVDFDASIPRQESSAISAMGRDGLSLNRPSAAQEELWKTEIDNALPTLLGPVFDRDIYQRINVILEKTRSSVR